LPAALDDGNLGTGKFVKIAPNLFGLPVP